MKVTVCREGIWIVSRVHQSTRIFVVLDGSYLYGQWVHLPRPFFSGVNNINSCKMSYRPLKIASTGQCGIACSQEALQAQRKVFEMWDFTMRTFVTKTRVSVILSILISTSFMFPRVNYWHAAPLFRKAHTTKQSSRQQSVSSITRNFSRSSLRPHHIMRSRHVPWTDFLNSVSSSKQYFVWTGKNTTLCKRPTPITFLGFWHTAH